jgi:hypothetical protein
VVGLGAPLRVEPRVSILIRITMADRPIYAPLGMAHE